MKVERLSRLPHLAGKGARLLDEYVRLPDAWELLDGVPEMLPKVLAEAIARSPDPALPPDGDVVLALVADDLVGQVMLVRHNATSVRLERLYVRPAFQRRGIARTLLASVINLAQTLHYDRVALDVMASRTTAIHLYERHGFKPIPAYAQYRVPMAFTGRDLSGSR